MLKFIYFIGFVLLLPNFSLQEDPFTLNECPITYHCNDTRLKEDEKVSPFCNKLHGGKMINRCCIENSTVIGLDLRYCDIKTLNISNGNFSNVEILDLRDNEFEHFTHKNLIGLLKLNYLYLSSHIPCPGGIKGWESIIVDNTTTCCYDQRDYCASLNVTCGSDEKKAKCQHLGPASARCECLNGHFAYKCLNQGEFPTTLCCTSVIIPTIVLSFVLWFVQGRDPYKRVYIED